LGQDSYKICSCARLDHGKKGQQRVKLAGLDDKRQITAVFAATMNWRILATAAGLQRYDDV